MGFSGVHAKPLSLGVLDYPHPSGVLVQEGALAAQPTVALKAACLPQKNSYLGPFPGSSVEDVLLQETENPKIHWAIRGAGVRRSAGL